MFQLLVNQNVTGFQTAQITGNTAKFKTAVFHAVKSFDGWGRPTYNPAPVYFGFETGYLPFQLFSGQTFVLTQPDRVKGDLSNMWFGAVSGNGLFITCQE